MKKNAQTKYDEVQSSMEETNKRRKQIQGQLKKKEGEKVELEGLPTRNEKQIAECERKVEKTNSEKQKCL